MTQICSCCDKLLPQYKRRSFPICKSCQRIKVCDRSNPKIFKYPNHWENWVCECGFIIPKTYYGCFTCLAINPRFHENNKSEVFILQDTEGSLQTRDEQ